MIPLKELARQQNLTKNATAELRETIPVQSKSPLGPDAQAEKQAEDGVLNNMYLTELLLIPTMKLKSKSNRRKDLNYKAEAVTKDLFNPQPSTSGLAATKQTAKKCKNSKKSES